MWVSFEITGNVDYVERRTMPGTQVPWQESRQDHTISPYLVMVKVSISVPFAEPKKL